MPKIRIWTVDGNMHELKSDMKLNDLIEGTRHVRWIRLSTELGTKVYFNIRNIISINEVK